MFVRINLMKQEVRLTGLVKVRVNLNFFLKEAMKAQRRYRGIALLFP